ncbi:MAG: hypothetical protein H6815_03095 [Phycisphaeraceae bacterium]|nr:hypothetical protein [Phycisphaerales bacterium]MCB9859414.1 hypothetical protein [Phycisphaeraceae bacterium]
MTRTRHKNSDAAAIQWKPLDRVGQKDSQMFNRFSTCRSCGVIAFVCALVLQLSPACAQTVEDVRAWFTARTEEGRSFPEIGKNELQISATLYCPYTADDVEMWRPQVREAFDHPKGAVVGWYDTEQKEGPEVLTVRYWCTGQNRVRYHISGGRQYDNPYKPPRQPGAGVFIGALGREPQMDMGLNASEAWVLETQDLRVDNESAVDRSVKQSWEEYGIPGLVDIRMTEVRDWVSYLLQSGITLELNNLVSIREINEVSPDCFIVVTESKRTKPPLVSEFRIRYMPEFEDFVVEQMKWIAGPYDAPNAWSSVREFHDHRRDPVTGKVHPYSVELSGCQTKSRTVLKLEKYIPLETSPSKKLFATPEVPFGDDPVRGSYQVIAFHDLRNGSTKTFNYDGTPYNYHVSADSLKGNRYAMLGWMLCGIGVIVLGVFAARKYASVGVRVRLGR